MLSTVDPNNQALGKNLLKDRENSFSGSNILDLFKCSALYYFNFIFSLYISDVDIMRVSVCICLFFVILFAVLRWIPRSFTIGEAMVISETIVLLSVDSYTNLGLKVNCTLIS